MPASNLGLGPTLASAGLGPSLGFIPQPRSRAAVEQRQLQPVDFLQRPASDALQVAVQPGRRLDDAANLLFALGPQPHHCLAFAVEVGLHVAEPLDHGLDPVPNRGPVKYW